MPIERIIGGPDFRSPVSDPLTQMAVLMACALLKQEQRSSVAHGGTGDILAFDVLDCALNRRAARRDSRGIGTKIPEQ